MSIFSKFAAGRSSQIGRAEFNELAARDVVSRESGRPLLTGEVSERDSLRPEIAHGGTTSHSGPTSHGSTTARARRSVIGGWLQTASDAAKRAFPTPPVGDSEERSGDAHDAELMVAVFRTLVLFAVLLGPHLLGRSASYEASEIWLAAVAGVYNIITGLGCLLPSRYGLRRPFIVAMDLLLISMWIQLSSQWELRPFFYIVVVVAAMWFRVFGGIVTAAFCNFFFFYIWFRAVSEAIPEARNQVLITTQIAIDTVLLLAVGCLVGYIAESQERERERRLEDQLLIANYQREIDLSTGLQPSLIAPQWIGEGNQSTLENGGVRRDEALEIGAAMQSARTLGGGDYFDIIALPEGRTALCIADVSGKSVRAQARLPLLKYSLRALAPLYPQPHALIERLNETLAPDLQPELYIAFCYVVLDAKRETLSWCNAGHIAPLLIPAPETSMNKIAHQTPLATQITALETDGPALGMFPDMTYESRTLPWRPGAQLLLFTDGLSDAFSYRGSEDGEAQVQKLAMRLRDQPQRDLQAAAREWVELAAAVLDDSSPLQRAHSALSQSPLKYEADNALESRHRDDITVVIARHTPTNSRPSSSPTT